MRLHLPVALGALLLGGCSVATYHRPVGPVPISEGSIDAFSPLVPGSKASSRCEAIGASPAEADARSVALVYAQPAEQQVTVMLDADGAPMRYTDVRGDLSMSGREFGDRTTIGLYLAEGYAVLSNRPSGREPTVVEVPLAEAISSEELGNPGAMLEHVLATCGQDRP